MSQWAGRRSGRARVAFATFLVASGALGIMVHASEPPVPEPVETGELDGAIVAVGLPPVPPPVPEPVETGELDGAVVAVGLPPVPPPATAPTPAPAAPAPVPAAVAEPAPDPTEGAAAVGAIVADAAASVRAAERLVSQLGF